MNFEHNENDVNDSTTSKTMQCQTYSFQTTGTIIYNFIDTPGLSDVGGYLKDDANVDMIFDKIEQLPSLRAIILVLNGAVGRLTTNVKNVLQRFRERIPDTFYSNLIILLTNCEQYSCNFELDRVGLPSLCAVVYMQNSAFSVHPDELTPKQKEIRKKEWKQAMAIIPQFLEHIDRMAHINTDAFRTIHDERNLVKTLLHESRLIIMELQQVNDILSSLASASKAYSSEKNKYKDFYQDEQISTNEWFETNYHNTLCMTCDRVCHEQCTLQETSRIGEPKECLIFRHGKCEKCKCKPDVHYHKRKTLRQVKKSVRTVVNHLYTKFENASAGQTKIQHEALSAEDTKEMLQRALQAQLHEIEKLCRQVKEQCAGYNSVIDLNTFVTVLEKDAVLLKSPYAREQADSFVNKLKNLCGELSNTESKRSCCEDEMARAVIAPVESDSSFSEKVENEKPTTRYKKRKKGRGRRKNKSRSTSEEMEVDDNHDVEPVTTTSREQSPLAYQSAPDDDSETHQNERSAACAIIRPVSTQSSSTQSASVSVASAITHNRAHEDMSRLRFDYKKASTAELIGMHADSDHEQKRAVEKELSRRCHGESFGFLDEKQIAQFASFVHSCQHSDEELLKRSHSLTQEIQRLADFHPLGIVNVTDDKLIELAAVNSLLRKATKK